jgi:hypothetical protein
MAFMTKRESIAKELEQLPDGLLDLLLDLVRCLRMHGRLERADTAVASEAALAKDWMRPEEDTAWRDL